MFMSNRNNFNNFDRNFNRMRRFVTAFITIAIVFWIFLIVFSAVSGNGMLGDYTWGHQRRRGNEMRRRLQGDDLGRWSPLRRQLCPADARPERPCHPLPLMRPAYSHVQSRVPSFNH